MDRPGLQIAGLDYELLYNGDGGCHWCESSEWHAKVFEQVVLSLSGFGAVVNARMTDEYNSGGERLQLSHGMYIRQGGREDYALIDFKDDVSEKKNRYLRENIYDPSCRFILKCQYSLDYGHMLGDKIRPYTYFEKAPVLFQGMLPALRKLAKGHKRLYYRGKAHEGRESILRNLSDILIEEAPRLKRAEYYGDAAAASMGLALPGAGNVCHREIEYFGMGVVTIMPVLKNEFYEPIRPGIHYIGLAVDMERDGGDHVVEAIRQAYERYYNDEEFLALIRRNAMEWYDRNVWFPSSIPLTLRLLGVGRE